MYGCILYIYMCVHVYNLVVAACPKVVSWSPTPIICIVSVTIMIRVNVVCSNVLVVTISFDN